MCDSIVSEMRYHKEVLHCSYDYYYVYRPAHLLNQ